MELDKWETGRWGEDLAARYLERRGWKVVARNFRAGPHEIDLIVTRGPVVAFVEVKTRRTSSGGTPLEPIGRQKVKAVAAAARRWVFERGRPGQLFRFDAVSIRAVGPDIELVHIPDAWRLG